MIDLGYRAIMPAALGRLLAKIPAEDRGAGGMAADGADDGMDSSDEEYADSNEVARAQMEHRKRDSKMAKWRGAVQVTSVALLGLRRLRAAYAEQIEMWAQLEEQAQKDPELTALDPHPLDQGEAQQPRAPAGPSRELIFRDKLVSFAASVTGSRAIREIRWAALTPDQLASRLRRELPLTGATPRQIAHVAAEFGVPTRCNGVLEWGGTPTWRDALAALQRVCECIGGAVDAIARFSECNGARLPSRPEVLPPCRWCHAAVDEHCDACGCAVHAAGLCGAWLRGAHAVFARTVGQNVYLCPDCALLWMFAMRVNEVAHPTPGGDDDIKAHMLSVASEVLPPAGRDALSDTPPKMRRCRRWVIRRLRQTNEPVSIAQIMDDAKAVFNSSRMEEVVNQCLQRLCQDDVVLVDSDGLISRR